MKNKEEGKQDRYKNGCVVWVRNSAEGGRAEDIDVYFGSNEVRLD